MGKIGFGGRWGFLWPKRTVFWDWVHSVNILQLASFGLGHYWGAFLKV
jgi:hypothetical protein